jgi:hypothetical protein
VAAQVTSYASDTILNTAKMLGLALRHRHFQMGQEHRSNYNMTLWLFNRLSQELFKTTASIISTTDTELHTTSAASNQGI